VEWQESVCANITFRESDLDASDDIDDVRVLLSSEADSEDHYDSLNAIKVIQGGYLMSPPRRLMLFSARLFPLKNGTWKKEDDPPDAKRQKSSQEKTAVLNHADEGKDDSWEPACLHPYDVEAHKPMVLNGACVFIRR
jgi:hypothetical protein